MSPDMALAATLVACVAVPLIATYIAVLVTRRLEDEPEPDDEDESGNDSR